MDVWVLIKKSMALPKPFCKGRRQAGRQASKQRCAGGVRVKEVSSNPGTTQAT
jgi:hypothetical protein